MSSADLIREYVINRLIVPARNRGDVEIVVRAGDVHHAMRLSSAMPNVCSALGGSKLAELAGVRLIEREGPPQGANVYFRFALSGTATVEPTKRQRSSALTASVASGTSAVSQSLSVTLPDLSVRGTLVLVSCVKSKLPHRAPARELYTSALFAKTRQIVERSGAPWFILSALYGLATPDEEIEPYERTLKAMSHRERKQWAEQVFTVLEPNLKNVERVVFFAGARYREYLEPRLRERGIAVEVPMEGLSLGEQLSWLSAAQ